MNKYKEIAQTTRLLSMYRMLLCGESLCKKELAARYAVSEKSIQRDIECLRDFIAETEAGKIRLIYTRRENRYILDSSELSGCPLSVLQEPRSLASYKLLHTVKGVDIRYLELHCLSSCKAHCEECKAVSSQNVLLAGLSLFVRVFR